MTPTFQGVTTTLRTSSGDLVLPRVLVTDIASVAAQTIQDTLSLWRTEWFLDQNQGFPWAQNILGVRFVTTSQINSQIKNAILGVPNVVTVIVQSTFDRVKRNLAFNFVAKINTGQFVSGDSFSSAYIITGGI